MGSVFMKRVQAGLAYARLAVGDQAGAFLLMADARNVGNLTLKDSLGNECEWVPGQAVLFGDANLYDIQFKGAVTDYIYIFGGDPRAGGFGDVDTSVATILAAIQAAVEIMDDWDESDRAKVNLIVGQAGISAGAGAVDATTIRAILASDDPAVTLLSTIGGDTSALSATTAASGATKPANVVQVGGTDGTDLYPLTIREGDNASQTMMAAVTTDPNAHIRLDAIANTTAVTGATTPARVAQVGGTDGTNLNALGVRSDNTIIAVGDNLVDGVKDIIDQSPFAGQKTDQTLLNAVTAATAGISTNVRDFGVMSARINVSVNTGAVTVSIYEYESDGTTKGALLWTETFTATTGKRVIAIEGQFDFIGVETTAQTNATVTAKLIGRGQ